MKPSTIVRIKLILFFVCGTAKGQNFLNREEIDQIQQVIDQNKYYPPLDSTNLSPLVIGLIMSFGGNIDSSGAVPGVRVALDRINNDTSLLPGYSLHYALSDSRVSLRVITATLCLLPHVSCYQAIKLVYYNKLITMSATAFYFAAITLVYSYTYYQQKSAFQF